VLNNYLINSSSVDRHCHPNDFLAWVVRNHDLCLWNSWSNNCSVCLSLFVMLMGSEDHRRKRSFKRAGSPNVISNAFRFFVEVFGHESCHHLLFKWEFFEREFWRFWVYTVFFLKSDLCLTDMIRLNICFWYCVYWIKDFI
jgi:hypothetical protein